MQYYFYYALVSAPILVLLVLVFKGGKAVVRAVSLVVLVLILIFMNWGSIWHYATETTWMELNNPVSGNSNKTNYSPDRVNRTVGGYNTSTLGYLPIITIRPGGKSVEISSYNNSCLRIEYVSGSHDYQAHSRGADGTDHSGMILGAQQTWIVLPASARENAIIQVRRRAC